MINQETQDKIREIREHLFKLHDAWARCPFEDGHHKSNEGYVGVVLSFPNWFEQTDYLTDDPNVSIEVYSYLFGPHRLHQYKTVDEALTAVKSWSYNPPTSEDE